MLVMSLVVHRPESRRFRLAQRWAAGDEVDREAALEDTYTWTRNTGVRALWFFPIWGALLLIVVGVVAGASGLRLVQYEVVGAVAAGVGMALIGTHSFGEGILRPVRAALGGIPNIGDSLPRSRPTFAAWLVLSMLGSMLVFSVIRAMPGALPALP
ncbi:hypothetical protein [Mycobacterium parmense]|uniref:Uncharacterized protein n=1 Tax=Mycobacterium parmense TaxID=185642 RepID=A0A7I7Z269_9MYCO|nr:hypothetical protein [Mycobacterium parmense]MCV7352178.1 hypothetical protein [Mycobacterium parmense]BBZ48100.1 hypothetical protein MPRM_53810 [Mycobacterium parmense]